MQTIYALDPGEGDRAQSTDHMGLDVLGAEARAVLYGTQLSVFAELGRLHNL